MFRITENRSAGWDGELTESRFLKTSCNLSALIAVVAPVCIVIHDAKRFASSLTSSNSIVEVIKLLLLFLERALLRDIE